MNKKKIKILASLIVLGSTSFILSFLILPPPRALAEEYKKANVGLNMGFLRGALAKEEDEKANVGLSMGLSKAKFTVSTRDLIVSSSSEAGFAVGIDFLYDVIEHISLGAGLMYIEKGGEFTTTVRDNGRRLSVEVKNNFDYLAIPILVHFHVGYFVRPFALFSLEPSFLLDKETTYRVGEIEENEIKKTEEDIPKDITKDITDDLRIFDFGIGFGAGIVLGFFSFQAKYILGLTNIAKSREVEMKNRASVILFEIYFNPFF
jgi:hypothetical protein